MNLADLIPSNIRPKNKFLARLYHGTMEGARRLQNYLASRELPDVVHVVAEQCVDLIDAAESFVPDFPTVVTLCGSTRFRKEYEEVQRRLTLEGHIVISVGLFGHLEGLDMDGEVKEKLDQLHKRKIDMSDFIFVINPGNYIGSSTHSEIDYAKASGKAVHYYCDPSGPAKKPRRTRSRKPKENHGGAVCADAK